MKIAIGCDHIVTDLKDYIKIFLESKGHIVIDKGTFDFERTHYPIFGRKVGLAVITKEADRGIVICGTGVGIINSATKIPGVRSILARNLFDVKYARQNLDINVLGIGGRIIGKGIIEELIDIFLKTPFINFKNEKLIKRINELNIDKLEKLKDNKIFDDLLCKWEEGYYHD